MYVVHGNVYHICAHCKQQLSQFSVGKSLEVKSDVGKVVQAEDDQLPGGPSDDPMFRILTNNGR
ncbi:hypothetical protein DPMN_157413 [Dreissena polymorpha]|uniref:Uncharacterized protein n=1 Tax=Dreissena polymorpha TaxID=45954 RepID=A0A9D4EI10_DREPO|nr:hypothetical protein DPMN_157413 [Dreissena polymorpha]